MEPWMYMSALGTAWAAIYMIFVTVGFEDSGIDFSVHSMKLYVTMLTALMVFNLYKLNGFYSHYRTIKAMKAQRQHQILYNDKEQP